MKKAIIAVAICLAFVSINCGKGSRASINTMIHMHDMGGTDVEPQFSLEIYKDDGFAFIPMIIVNSETLQTEEGLTPSSEEIFNFDCITDWLLPGGDFNMTVDYGEGKGQVKDSLPGIFDITAPEYGDVLELNQDFAISWGTSQCAGWYWVNADVDYYYLDNDSLYQNFEYEIDTIVHETSLTIPADDIFPSDVVLIYYGSAYAYVGAYTGPDPKPLAKGNVTGDAVGFSWAYYDQVVSIDVGLQAAQRKTGTLPDLPAQHTKILLDWAHQQ